MKAEAPTHMTAVHKFFLWMGVFFVYLLTLPHTVTLEDSGAFMIAAKTLGIAHPPGYPLYTLLAHLMTYLPFGSTAFQIPLLSALCGATSCLLVCLILYKTTQHLSSAIFASLFLAFGQLFWWQSIIAEVYALHALFFVALFYLILLLRENWSPRTWLLSVFLFSLSLTNHWPLMILSSPALLFLMHPLRKNILPTLPKSLFVFLVGLTPYIYLMLISKTNPAFSFFGTIESFAELREYIARSMYASVDTSLTASYKDSAKYIWHFLKLLLYEYFYFGCVFIILGICAAYKSLQKSQFYSLLYALLSSSVIFKLFSITDFNQHQADIYSAYLLVPMLASSIFIGFGIHSVYNHDLLKSKKRKDILTLTLASFLLLNLVFHWRTNDKRQDTFADDYAQIVLSGLPTDHPLITWTDVDSNPIAFKQLVDNFRPGVDLYHRYGLLFSNRLFDPRASSPETQGVYLAQFIKKSAPVYSIEDMGVGVKYGLKTEFNGLFAELAESPKPANTYSALANAALDFLNKHPIDEYPRHWPYLRSHIRGKMCQVILNNGLDHPALNQDIQCRRAKARHLTSTGRLKEADVLHKQLILDTEHLLPSERAQVYHSYLDNLLSIMNAGTTDSIGRTLSIGDLIALTYPALEISRKCDNPVLLAYLRLMEQTEIPLDRQRVRHLFSHCPGIRL